MFKNYKSFLLDYNSIQFSHKIKKYVKFNVFCTSYHFGISNNGLI